MYTKFTIVGGVNLCYAIIVATCKRYYTKGEKNDIDITIENISFYFIFFIFLQYFITKKN
jgi:hypothetical protein